jgi:hypothetical protein
MKTGCTKIGTTVRIGASKKDLHLDTKEHNKRGESGACIGKFLSFFVALCLRTLRYLIQ